MGDFSRKNRIRDVLSAGALTALILLAAFYREGIVPFGSNTLAVTDTNVQYLDLFAYYRDVLTGQNTIGSTFSYMLGTGMAGVFAYYLASPFLLLVVFFPKEQMNLFLSVLVLLKLSTAAMTFRWFLQGRLVSVPGGVSDRVLGRGSERNYGNIFPPNRRPGTGRLKGKPQNSRPQSNGSDSRQVNRSQRGSGTLAPAAALVLSVSYGLMQYNLAQAGNVMWLDGVILLPVMLLYVSEIVWRSARRSVRHAGCQTGSRANLQAGGQTGSRTSRWARDQAGKRADSRANRQAGDQSSWQTDRKTGKRAGGRTAGLCKLAVVTGMGLMFSWYTGAINCLFSLVWFVYESVRAKSFRGAKHFFAGLMLGGLLSCFVMVPNWMALRLGKGAEPVQMSAFDLGWIGNPLSILTYYKIGAMSDAYHVSLYCGVLAAVGAAAFLVLAGRRERRAALGLLVFVVLMYYWKPLIYVFSLLRKVDSYWSRYGYLGCFVLLYFAAEGLARLDAVLPEAVKRLPAREETGDAAQAERAAERRDWEETGDAAQAERAKKRLDREEAGDAAQAERAKGRPAWVETGDASQAETMGRRTDRSFGWRRAAGVVLVALVSVNLFLEASAMINIYHSDTAQEYAKYARRAAKQVASIKDYDASRFYRINETSTRIYNVDGLTSAYQDPLAYGYASVGGYTSCPENAQLAFLESIGYREEYDSFNIVSTAFLPADTLLGVRYELSGEALPGLTELPSLGRRNQKSVYYNSYALPAAMLADAGDGAADSGAWEAVEAGEWEAADGGAGEATEAGARSETGEGTQPAANDVSQSVKGEENQPAAGNGSQSTSDDASRLNASAAAGKRAEVRSARWVKPEVTNRQSKVFETLEELYSNLYGEPAGLFVPVEAASQWQDGRMIWTLQVPEGNVVVYGNLLWDEEFVGKLSVQEGMRHGYGMWLSPSVFWIPVPERSGGGADMIDDQNAALRAGSGSEETDSEIGNGMVTDRGGVTAQITLECDDPSLVTQAQFYALDLEQFREVTDRIRARSEKAVQILTWNGREIRVAVKAEAADAVRPAQSVDTEITMQSAKAANTTQSAKAGNTKSADETEAAERQSSSRILILSAANSPGWTVFCNGEKVEPETFGGCLVQIPLPPGEAEIEMRYRTPGQMPGIILSVVGAACLILLRTLRPTTCTEKAGGRRTQVVAETDDMHRKGGGSSDISGCGDRRQALKRRGSRTRTTCQRQSKEKE